MNSKIMITTVWVCILLLSACVREKPLGEITPLTGDYVLPQGKSSADERVVQLHKKYGSYFLYEFSRRDFNWKFFDPSLLATGDAEYQYNYTPADPKYVGDMLDWLNETWFRHFPDSLLQKSIPYRVLFVSTLERKHPDEETHVEPQSIRLESNQFVFAGCNETIKKISEEEKNNKRIVLQYELLSFLIAGELLNYPQEFYKVSDYSSNANDNPNSNNYARKRGFLPSSYYNTEWSLEMQGRYGDDMRESDMLTDISSYLYHTIVRTDNEWEEDFAFPLVKQKYNLLVNHFGDKFGIDIHKMATAPLKTGKHK